MKISLREAAELNISFVCPHENCEASLTLNEGWDPDNSEEARLLCLGCGSETFIDESNFNKRYLEIAGGDVVNLYD